MDQQSFASGSRQGTESSRVEAILRAVPGGNAPSLSGLEATAPGGDGEGIEPFRPSPRLVEIGISMRVPLDKASRAFSLLVGSCHCRACLRRQNRPTVQQQAVLQAPEYGLMEYGIWNMEYGIWNMVRPWRD